MKLLIVSHTPHYIKNGKIMAWGPTVREIDYLAPLFTAVRHMAFLYEEKAPESSLPYQAVNVNFVPLSPSGGKTFADKLKILFKIPCYVQALLREMRQADVVHV